MINLKNIKKRNYSFRNSLQRFGYSSRLMHVVSTLGGHSCGSLILMYHSVADNETAVWIDPTNHVPAEIFAQQIEFLAKRHSIISLFS